MEAGVTAAEKAAVTSILWHKIVAEMLRGGEDESFFTRALRHAALFATIPTAAAALSSTETATA